MITTPEPGLRERKRALTHAALERAAVEIAAEQSIEQATVEAICARAGVSPRTFFNYFESKDDAIVGIRDIAIDPDLLREATRQGDSLVDAVIDLLVDLMTPAFAQADLFPARRELLRQHPHLLGRQAAQLRRMTDELSAAVVSIMAAQDPRNNAAPHPDLVVALCGTAVRVAVHERVDSRVAPTPDLIATRARTLTRTLLETLR